MGAATEPTPRDLEALALAEAAGFVHVPTAEGTAELGPEGAVELALSWHLARLEARVEDAAGGHTTLRPRRVDGGWPEGNQPSAYPSLTVRGRTSRRATTAGIPVVLDDQDVISADNAWSLWLVGEDEGEGLIHVFASYKAHRDALARAVKDALQGDLDRLMTLGLPMPELGLPPPFRELLPVAQLPHVNLWSAGDTENVDDENAAASGVWRADVPFRWQAPRFAARPRIPDLASTVEVRIVTET